MSDAKAKEYLGRVELFAALSDTELERIAAIVQEERFPKGAKIFREGEPGDKLYMIAEGKVRISKQIPGIGEEALAILEPGSVFGEMGLLDDAPRSADAIAHTEVRLYTIERMHFDSMLFVDKELAYQVLSAIVRILARRLRETNEKMAAFFAMNKF